MKRLKITIYPDGYVHTETIGVKGTACEKYRPFFQKLLNNRVIEQTYTDEYYEEIAQDIEQKEEENIYYEEISY